MQQLVQPRDYEANRPALLYFFFLWFINMMSTRVIGLGAALRKAAINPSLSKLSHRLSTLYLIFSTSRQKPPASFTQHPPQTVRLPLLRACLCSGIVSTIRAIQTESLPPSANELILNQQRLKRPSSPHFTIYQPQLTWIMSIANRVTGVALSVRKFILLVQHFDYLIPHACYQFCTGSRWHTWSRPEHSTVRML